MLEGDLLFSSTAERFQTDLLLSRDITSRTFSFYYPDTRPDKRPRTLIVSSTNANYEDWNGLSEEEYEVSKQDLVDTTLDALEKYGTETYYQKKVSFLLGLERSNLINQI